MVGIAAYKCLTSAQGPFYATLDPSDPNTERRDPPRVRPDYDPGGLSQRNTIIVAVVGSVVTTALSVLTFLCCTFIDSRTGSLGLHIGREIALHQELTTRHDPRTLLFV